MVDPVIIITLSTSVMALATSLLTHIRYSNCYGVNCMTRSNPTTPNATTPLINQPPSRSLE